MLRVLVLSLLLVCICGCRETVVHNLSEPDANRMLAHLYDHKLDAKKVKQPDGRWSLSLPNNQVAGAIKTLDANKLLRSEATDFSQQSGFMSSQEQERFRFERALSREIEATLSSLPTVLQARVYLNLPVVDPVLGFKPNESQGSASVMLLSNSEHTNRDEVTALVAGASGVKAADISVIISVSMEKQPYEISLALSDKPHESVNTDNMNNKQAETYYGSVIKQYLTVICTSLKKIFLNLPALFALFSFVIFILVFRKFNRRQKLMI